MTEDCDRDSLVTKNNPWDSPPSATLRASLGCPLNLSSNAPAGIGCGQNQLGLKLQSVGRLLILLLTTAVDAVVGNAHPTKKPASSTFEHTSRDLQTTNKQPITNN